MSDALFKERALNIGPLMGREGEHPDCLASGSETGKVNIISITLAHAGGTRVSGLLMFMLDSAK